MTILREPRPPLFFVPSSESTIFSHFSACLKCRNSSLGRVSHHGRENLLILKVFDNAFYVIPEQFQRALRTNAFYGLQIISSKQYIQANKLTLHRSDIVSSVRQQCNTICT